MYKKFILSVLMIFSVSIVQANEYILEGCGTSIEDLTHLAEQGDADAQYELGELLYYSGGEDCAEGLEWLGKAKEQGHHEARNTINLIRDFAALRQLCPNS